MLRFIFWTTLIALVMGCVWRYGAPQLKQQLLQQADAPHRPRPFKFDNGSHRDDQPALPAGQSAKSAATSEPAPGVLRKCAQGGQVIYTNVHCPAGFALAPIKGGTVNVVGEQDSLRTASTEAGAQAEHQSRRPLLEALDLNDEASLRARMMERAIEGSP